MGLLTRVEVTNRMLKYDLATRLFGKGLRRNVHLFIIEIRITHPPSLIEFTNFAQPIDNSLPLIDRDNATSNGLHGLDSITRPRRCCQRREDLNSSIRIGYRKYVFGETVEDRKGEGCMEAIPS